MSKQNADAGTDESAAKKKPKKSSTTKKSTAKKPKADKTAKADKAEKADKTKKPAAKKRPTTKKKPATKAKAKAKPVDEDQVSEVSREIIDLDKMMEAADQLESLEDVEDAEVVSETRAGDAFPDVDEDAITEVAIQPPPLSEEERELAAIYGDDLSATATAHAEYHDRQTADEDRQMLPEINAREERKQQWQDRRAARKARREQRHERREQRQQVQRDPDRDRKPTHPMPTPVQINGHDVSAEGGEGDGEGLGRVGTPLGDAAATVFAQLRNGQPLPVRQLAAMMRKRSLVESDPEQLAPQLKAELLGDERSYRTLGLRPRIVYRGRDLFAPGPVASSVTAGAEAGVASALSRLASATHRALAQRIAKASPAGFERLIHAYLVAAGYRDIAWVKRVGGISYAQVLAPGIDRTILISARSGDQPIDRRGIGELRVGVEAKNLVAGILFSAGELSEDAERELERAGRSIAVVCGDQLVATLIAAGVGVVSAAAPLRYVDDQLLDELLAG